MSITDLQKQEIENLKWRLDKVFSVYQEKIYRLIYSLNNEEYKNKLKELYDKINKQNGEN